MTAALEEELQYLREQGHGTTASRIHRLFLLQKEATTKMHRRAQEAEAAVREKLRAVPDGQRDSRGLGRRMLGGVVALQDEDIARLQHDLRRLAEQTGDAEAAITLKETEQGATSGRVAEYVRDVIAERTAHESTRRELKKEQANTDRIADKYLRARADHARALAFAAIWKRYAKAVRMIAKQLTAAAEGVLPMLNMVAHGEAQNYATGLLTLKSIPRRCSITIQVEDGMTPGEHVAKVKAQLDELYAAMDRTTQDAALERIARWKAFRVSPEFACEYTARQLGYFDQIDAATTALEAEKAAHARTQGHLDDFMGVAAEHQITILELKQAAKELLKAHECRICVISWGLSPRVHDGFVCTNPATRYAWDHRCETQVCEEHAALCKEHEHMLYGAGEPMPHAAALLKLVELVADGPPDPVLAAVAAAPVVPLTDEEKRLLAEVEPLHPKGGT